MDVREKLVEILKQAPFDGKVLDEWWWEEKIRIIADHLISSGVTVQELVSVKDRLPEENEYVMIWCGEFQIARIEKGITEKERALMKNGEINDPVELGWNMSDGCFSLKRSDSYKACDEGFNNKVPYCWHVLGGMEKLFGQNVTHWMPLPEPPKGE